MRPAATILTFLATGALLVPWSASKNGIEIPFAGAPNTRTSLGIYEPTSGQLIRTLSNAEPGPSEENPIIWDGLDFRGRPVDAGTYEWRSLTAPGFQARYITTLGINPPGGPHPIPRYSWVGDHNGAGIVDVDDSGVYVGSPITEGHMMVMKFDPTMTRPLWRREQFYEGGRLTQIASNGTNLFTLHPTGKLRRLHPDNGAVEAVWDTRWDDAIAVDMVALAKEVVPLYPEKNSLRWLSTSSAMVQHEVAFEAPLRACAVGEESLYIARENRVYRVSRDGVVKLAFRFDHPIRSMDFDGVRNELWVALETDKILRVDSRGAILQEYGTKPRAEGRFDPQSLSGVVDIAVDLNGHLFVGEPHGGPRRLAWLHRDGSLLDQWFGGMSFYVHGAFAPNDPSRLYGIAPEGSTNVYQIDLEDGSWEIVESYRTGLIGDGLFPFSGAFDVVEREGQTFLYHRMIPSVVRLDPERGAIPVAIAGTVRNAGRSLIQFSGSGRDGYPKPWVAAAEFHGYTDLGSAPKLFSWADTNGDGAFDPAEFRFYPNADPSLASQSVGDFNLAGDYIAGGRGRLALRILPLARWEGPDKTAPRWDWDQATFTGAVLADDYGWSSPRGLSVAPNGSIAVAYQAGLMIKEHGQYEGGGWPERALKGARILGFDPHANPTFVVGRQSRESIESSNGTLFYPMTTMPGPHNTVVVNDQTKQAAQVWTHDGLYVGGLLDNRVDDGLDPGFYQVHGDDNQGGTVVTGPDDRTYWLMPYIGQNRLYEITGWNGWVRDSGSVFLEPPSSPQPREGPGLHGRYSNDAGLVLEVTEAPLHFDPLGEERHAPAIQAPYSVVWSGLFEAPSTDRYRFSALVGGDESLQIELAGRRLLSAQPGQPHQSQTLNLQQGTRYPISISYRNPDARAELKLFWATRSMDPTVLSKSYLYPVR